MAQFSSPKFVDVRLESRLITVEMTLMASGGRRRLMHASGFVATFIKISRRLDIVREMPKQPHFTPHHSHSEYATY